MKATIGLAALALAIGCGDRREHRGDDHGDEGGDRGDAKTAVVEISPEAARRVTIATTAATTRSLAAEIETTGQVQFDETRIAHVSPRIPGRLHEVSAQLGDRVDRGQALAVLDSVELGAAKGSYLQAKARAAVASQSFEREKRLAAREISSQKEMLEAQADDRVAHAGLLAAHQTLRLYGLSSGAIDRIGYDRSGSALVTLRAPLAGKIVEKHATSGELVTPESKIYTVADVAILWIWIDIYERDLARVHIGDQAYVRADAYPDDRFEGTVKYIEDQVDPNTRTLRARIEVANPDEKLRSGMFTRVRLADPHGADTEAVARPMVVIPRAAVQRDGDDRVVFVKTADDRYERRVVKLGRQTHDVVEVLDGVKAGDPVVTTGGFILKSEFAKGSLGGGHSH